MAKTILEIEKSVTPTMLAAGTRITIHGGWGRADRELTEDEARQIYAEMEWARIQQESASETYSDFKAAIVRRCK